MIKKYFSLLALVIAVSFSACTYTSESESSPAPEDRAAVEGTVIDISTDKPVEEVILVLRDSTTSELKGITFTNSSGFYTIQVDAGTYSIEIEDNEYEDSIVEELVVPEKGNKVILVDFSIMPLSYGKQIATICGKATKSSGSPLSNAIVSLSGESTTNGIFVSTKTDRNGNYSFRNVDLNTIENTLFSQLKLIASKDGYEYTSRDVTALEPNRTFAGIDLTLQDFSGTVLYSYTFELEHGFTKTGFWNRHSSNVPIFNSAAGTYVTIPEDDDTAGQVYTAYSGFWCYWYGSPSTGNYIGTQIENDPVNSGGTGMEANSGSLTTPLLDLTKVTNAYLEFKSLFEIEGDSPDDAGYDYMMVEISTDGGSTYTTLDLLNPYLHVEETSRAHLCVSSGGFNKAAKWANYKYNLTDYAGETVLVRFSFNTLDNLYNGFRGWFIDDVKIYHYKAV